MEYLGQTGSVESYLDTGVESGKTYRYVAIAFNEDGESPPSNESIVAVPFQSIVGYIGDQPIGTRFVGDSRVVRKYIGDTLIYSET
jgi:hypothetical protein